MLERLISCILELEDIISEIDQNNDKIIADPEQLELITAKLQTIYNLQKKHQVQTIAELITIQYPHIPKQTILVPSEAKLVKLSIETKAKTIAYIMGAGDEVPKSLENLGYTVTLIQPEAITLEKLAPFDAVLLGIRAFNVVDELKFKNKISSGIKSK